jgi:hypothetical protein
MKKAALFIFVMLTRLILLQAQPHAAANSMLLLTLNQQIDNYVVQRNINALDKLFANDFVFSHGSGKVEGKAGWFKSVDKGSFLSRQHDSVTAELHPGIAILRGKLSVVKKTEKENSRYHLKYIRVYALRDKQWQMVSHVTYWEYHEAD